VYALACRSSSARNECLGGRRRHDLSRYMLPWRVPLLSAHSIPRQHLSYDRQAGQRPRLLVCRLPRPLCASCPPPSRPVKALRCTSTSSPTHFPFSSQRGLINWIPHTERQPLAHLLCALRADGRPFTAGLVTFPWYEQDMVKTATQQAEGFYSSMQRLLAKGSDSSSDAMIE
jgi:hypothetical protein